MMVMMMKEPLHLVCGYYDAIAVQTATTIIMYLVHKYDIYLTSGLLHLLHADSWIVSAVFESSLPLISVAAVSSHHDMLLITMGV